jgi:hypothetical protein
MDCFDCGSALTEEETRQFSLDSEFRVNSRWDNEAGLDVPLCDTCFTELYTLSIVDDEEDEEEDEDEDEEEEGDEEYEVYCDECGCGIEGAHEEDYESKIPLCKPCSEPADDVLYE